MSQNEGIEMDEISLAESMQTAATEHPQSSLLPVDRGYAWKFLIASFFVELLCWGLPFSVGILLNYWNTTLFPGNESTLALAATLQTGIMYTSCLLWSPVLSRYPEYRGKMQASALFVAALAIILSGFATAPWHLIATLGIAYALASTLFYLPCAVLLFEWFATRRGIASGVMYSGTGIGGAIFPLLMSSLITHFGYKVAMVSLGSIFGVVGTICLRFIKPRIPLVGVGARTSKRINREFLRHTPFYAFLAAIFLTSAGNFMPSLYLPSFNPTHGVILISVMNIASVPGLLILGYLSDRMPVRVVLTISCGGAALACLTLWGLATNTATLFAFAVVFGFLGLAFPSVWTRFITIVSNNDPTVPPLVFSLFAFTRGIGNVISGPISTLLLNYDGFKGAGGFSTSNHGSLLLYTGLTIGAGSIAGLLFNDRAQILVSFRFLILITEWQ